MKKISFLLWAILCFSTILSLCETKTLIGPNGKIDLPAHPDDSVKKLPNASSTEFNGTIIYEPIGNDHIRLAGDSDYYNHGLVKVFRNNSWGYVCDDDWDINDANVACRQLGFNRGATNFVIASSYGEAKDGLYLMDDVECTGDEKQLQKCSYNIYHNCDKYEAAGVICNLNTGCEDQWIAGPTGCYRLFNGSMSRYDAENKCKSLNGHLVKIDTQEENNFLSSILHIEKEKHYWLTDGVKEQNWIWKTDGKPISSSFWFPGWEPQSQFPKPSNNTLKRCLALANAFKYEDSKYLSEYFYWDDTNCNNVGNFICETEKIKIPSDTECYTGTGTDYRGNTSVTANGTLCIKWTNSREINPSTHPNAGLGDHNYCRNPDGDSRPWCWVEHQRNLFSYCNIPKCSIITEITKDISPKSHTPIRIQLIGGSSEISGRIEITLGGVKGTICDDDFDNNDAKVICRMMGYSSGEVIPNTFGEGKGVIWLDDLSCTGSEYDLEVCPNLSWGVHDCRHYEDVAIKCSKEANTILSSTTSIPPTSSTNQDAVRIQLIGGSLEISGRVEITRQGVKGTVCDDEFDNNDAKVICRMMGYSSGEVIRNIFGEGQGTIWLDDLSCTGLEYDLEVCSNLSWGMHNCQHYEDVAIKCSKDANTTLSSATSIPPTSNASVRIQLVGGSSKISGRIEITHQGVKGTVCDDQFDNNDAKVICRMMGYSSGEDIPNTFGEGKGVIWLDDLSCTGSEYDVEVCPNLNWGVHNCGHDEDVAIKCSTADQLAVRIQLIGSSSEISGRIEIIRKGVKGTVCDDQFDNNDAKVICRMMGYSSGEVIRNIFGEGQGTIWLDDLSCTGLEDDLKVCPNISWGTHNCQHNEDVAIKCFNKANTTTSISPTSNDFRIQLIGGSAEISGRIEITRQGVKGTVCDDQFDNNDAKVICRMMGYSSGEDIPNTFGEGKGVIWLDDLSCTGSEYDVEVCPNLKWGVHNCGHDEDVAIKCSTADQLVLQKKPLSLTCPGEVVINVTTVNKVVSLSQFVQTENDSSLQLYPNTVYVSPEMAGKYLTVFANLSQDISCYFLVKFEATTCFKSSLRQVSDSTKKCTADFGDMNCEIICDLGFVFSDNTNNKTSTCTGKNTWVPSTNLGDCVVETLATYTTFWEFKYIIDQAVTGFNKTNEEKHLASELEALCSSVQFNFTYSIFDQKSDRLTINYNIVFSSQNSTKKQNLKSCLDTIIHYGLKNLSNLITPGYENAFLTYHNFSFTVTCPSSYFKVDFLDRNSYCNKCPSGTYGNQTDCIPCPVGEYRSINITGNCMKCPNGTSTHSNGSYSISQCLDYCPPGFSSDNGLPPCTPCPVDFYSQSSKLCKACENNSSTIGQTGSSKCFAQCPRGYYSLTGYQPCTKCPVNFYQNLVGSTKCLECSNSSFTNGTGAIECLTCTNVNCTQCKSNEKVKIENHQITCVVIRIELVGGSSELSGRIEIIRNGIRGTVCDDSFDNNDANVICRMMGYSSGEVISNVFGQGQGTIWLDELDCTGSEYDLEVCPNLSWGVHDCTHREDVAVQCFNEASLNTSIPPTLNTIRIQLLGGSSEISGRIEITHKGIKGTVCDDDFDNKDAKVICRMMGYSSGEVIPNIFGEGQGTIWLDDLNCTGSEYDLEVCPNISWGTHNCQHYEDVAIKCLKDENTTTSISPTSNDVRIQLIGGSSEISGRIEIVRNGVKGTVCDDQFDDNDAKVICRMIGYSSGEDIPNTFGEGKGVIWLDDLSCTGSEYDLEVCPNLNWGVHNCGHNEDVAIKCSKEANTTFSTTTSIPPTSSTDQTVIRIELVGGSSELSGRIEIIRNGIRGTVCDDSFDNNDANVICRMMGYSSGEVISNVFGQGQGTIWLDELDCTGSEYDLEVCPNLSWGVHDCTHREDVAVQCFNEASLNTSIPPTLNTIRIQLLGGSSEISGRIEITHKGIKGTVCDDDFDNKDAKVICRMMGYSSGEVIPNIFGEGQGTIWLDDLNCTGSEYDLEVCPNISWGTHNCQHYEDVAIKCLKDENTTTSISPTSNDVRIQLIGGSSEISGRIEIVRNGVKGTVCDDQFDDNDAKVICRMIGYSSGEDIPNTFGEGKGVIWLDDLSCTGSEYDLEVCPNLNWGVHNCGHNEDVAIKCSKEANTTFSTTTSIPPTSSTDQTVIRIELVGGSSELSGRIEIIRNGIRGTVCDDSFDNNDANVICRMMGYSSGEVISNVFGHGQGTIWLDELDCTGSEYDLEVCPNLSWGVHDCTHREDVAVQCFNEASLNTSIPPTLNTIRIQLLGGSSEISGRIEITHKGIKGTVCDDDFDNKDAKVICRMMGYSSGEVIPNIFGEGQGTIWLDDLNCTGSEYDLEVCPNISWGTHNCQHYEDVAIKCLKDENTTTSISPTSNDVRIQLIGGSSEISGRIEIVRNGVKGTVCDDQFDDNDAKVICRMIGYSSGEDIPNTFGEGKGVIWLDDLSCTGSEYDLEVCPNLNWGVHNCGHNEDVAIKCSKEANTTFSTTTSIPPTSSTDQTVIRIELVGGSSELSGRIEIIRNGIRGTVCDDSFDNNDANVICRMMGYSSGEVISNVFGQGQGTIWLDELDCTGSEYDLEVCPNLSWGVHDCTHREDVAVQCFNEASLNTSIPPTLNTIRIQLLGGSSEISGRIEITHKGIKGTVCDDDFDNKDAKVICRMMGYSSGEVIPNIFGEGQGTIWLDDLNCTGSEYDLEVCPNISWGTHNCQHYEDVAIKCLKDENTTTSISPTSNDVRIQLIGGSSEISGRIEIVRNGVKGTVCDDQFDDNDAKVICRMIGYSSGEDIPNTFGEGKGVIWLDDLSCTGSEYDLEVCPNLNWGVHNCGHNEDVAIKCSKEANTTFSTTTSIPPTSSTDQTVTCGRRPIKQSYQRFPGGQVAKYGAFPWQARILKVWFWGKLHHCGAAIINKFWLLTAAHCLKSNLKKKNMLLQTGDLNSRIWDTHEQSFQVEHSIAHPSYDSLTHDYDVGLIKLRPDRNGNGVVFNDYVQPVCLPPQNLSMSAGTRCEISGWGSTGQTYISVLKAAIVPMISRHDCEIVHKDITPRMLCAGYLQGGINACQGDHGGPLVCNINGVHTLIGITSWGNGCATPNYPGVYANVAYLKPWITATIAKYS